MESTNAAQQDARGAAVGDGPREPDAWCDRCGQPLAEGGHDGCEEARLLEPPRFCPSCRRRMTVQVLPAGWTAGCVEHGVMRSA